MDLAKFEPDELYFDTPVPEPVTDLLSRAAELYGEPMAETLLLRAYLIAPENLTVLVALYRYYFYQHRLEDALVIAERALNSSARLLSFPGNWRMLTRAHVGHGAHRSIGLVRFHLLALKAAGLVSLRLSRRRDAHEMLSKVAEMDDADRLGAKSLLNVVGLGYSTPVRHNEKAEEKVLCD
jgi:tetratricopeptide (TPR) repeat protein